MPARKMGDRREEATLERIQQSAALTPAPWLSQIARDARGALAAHQELRSVLDARCGRQAPALSKLRDTLESIRALVSTALQGRAPVPEQPAPIDGPSADADGAPCAEEPGRFPVRSRAEAYQLLALAAEFLARTEPHSPVPHLVRRAITWGGLGLEDLLPELVRDGDQVSQIYQLLQLGDKPRRS
jgi:type VI secretion system protein ImpA